MGKGRWDADALAEELGCSRRTVHRLLQTLTLAGVPWYYDNQSQCYRVRPGYRLPGLESEANSVCLPAEPAVTRLPDVAKKLLSQGEAFQSTLNELLEVLRRLSGGNE